MIKWTNYFNSSDNYNTIMDALMVIDASNDVVNTAPESQTNITTNSTNNTLQQLLLSPLGTIMQN